MATFDLKCGICGQDMAVEPDVSEHYGLVLLATCPGCRKEINDMKLEIGDLEDDVFEYKKALTSEQERLS